MPISPPMLLDKACERLHLKHFSLWTKEAYTCWIRGFVRFHHRRQPREMGKDDIERFLSWPAGERYVSVSAQDQAKAAAPYARMK